MNIIEDYNSHNDITEQLDLPNYGSEMVWKDFANYGFYVYDWSLDDRLYVRQSKPTSKISEKIINKLSKLRSLIILKDSFDVNEEIIID